MSERIVMRTGEALVAGGPPGTAAEPEIIIGELDGPVGTALATLTGDQVAGHSRVFAILNTDIQVRPVTLMVSKVTVKNSRTKFCIVLECFTICVMEIRNKNNIYVQLECWADQHTSTSIETIQISLTETTNSHNAAAHMQAQQDLLSLIFTITDNISTAFQFPSQVKHCSTHMLRGECCLSDTFCHSPVSTRPDGILTFTPSWVEYAAIYP